MKNECSIVRDILPLYSEGMLSEDSVSFVEDHLKICSKCNAELETMKKSSEIDKACVDDIQQRNNDALPLKTVKKKFRKRRILTVIAAVFLTFTVICICLNLKPASIDYGSSDIYSKQDMDGAIKIIKDEFYSWDGCKLYSVSYTSDELCKKELEYCNTLSDDGLTFTECIVFRTCFRSPVLGGEAWNPNDTYYWNWYLARVENGPWKLLTWGAG